MRRVGVAQLRMDLNTLSNMAQPPKRVFCCALHLSDRPELLSLEGDTFRVGLYIKYDARLILCRTSQNHIVVSCTVAQTGP